jgi:hypothetical protein
MQRWGIAGRAKHAEVGRLTRCLVVADAVAVRHPSMSTRGTRIAFVIAIVLVGLLPKRTECSYPGATCGHAGRWRTTCTDFEIEPLGLYLLELVVKRDVGFAYSTGEDCR